MSRAAVTVNRERGTESAIGVGSGELLNHMFILLHLSLRRQEWRIASA
jgi:hypothetical protein